MIISNRYDGKTQPINIQLTHTTHTQQYWEIVSRVEDDTFDAMEQFHRSFTNDALWITTAQGPDEQDYFPFVVIHDWELRGHTLRESVPAVQTVAWCPMVGSERTDQWNSFVASHAKDWLQESFEVAQIVSNVSDANFRVSVIVADDGDGDGYADGAPFFSRWQVSPPPVNVSDINTNVMEGDATLRDLSRAVVEARQGLFSGRRHHHPADANETLGLLSPPQPPPPTVTYIEPVYNDLFDSASSLAGLVIAEVSMAALIQSVLPLGQFDSIAVVLRSSCGTYDTFEIHGSTVRVVGCCPHFSFRPGQDRG
jgi:hypothetical protein